MLNCLVEIQKIQDLWYDLKKLLWQDELNPRVRCAFGNVLNFNGILQPLLTYSNVTFAEKRVLWTNCPWKTLLVIFDLVEKPGCRMADLFCCIQHSALLSAAQLQLHRCCPERLNCLVMTRLRGQVGRWNCVLDKRAALSHVHACPDPQFKTPLLSANCSTSLFLNKLQRVTRTTCCR